MCIEYKMNFIFFCRLRELLRQEEEMYIHEMEAKEETTLERQAKMREQAKQLKEKREAERLAFVQEKLDQQWRFASLSCVYISLLDLHSFYNHI